MGKMKQRMAALMAAALMASSMPVTAANAAVPADVGSAAPVTEKSGEAATVSGQMGQEKSGTAEEIAGKLLERITEEEISEIVCRAEDAFTETGADGETDEADGTDGWDILRPFIEKEAKDYLTGLLEKAKGEYPDLQDEEVYRMVFDGMCEKTMETIELFFKENGISVMSLLPLEEKYISVDLRGLTPVELTMVPFSRIFAGEDMTGVSEIAYAYGSYSDDYVIGKYSGNANLSMGTTFNSDNWMMIPGGDQLNGQAKRYVVSIDYTNAENWLIPEVYIQDGDGKRTRMGVSSYDYSDTRRLDVRVRALAGNVPDNSQIYLKFDLNSSIFGTSANRNSIKVYEGCYEIAEEASRSRDITSMIFGNIDMKQNDAGYIFENYYDSNEITIVSFDVNGKVTGCLPLTVELASDGSDNIGSHVETTNMFQKIGENREYVSYSSSTLWLEDGIQKTFKLYDGYAADGRYQFTMNYYPKGGSGSNNSLVTAAYEGKYESIAAAQKAGAENIKEKLFGMDKTVGYGANYSKGVYFSIFVGADGVKQEIYHYCIQTKEGIAPKSSNVRVRFFGLMDKDGNRVDCYAVKSKDDSYAEGNYPIIMVEAGVDTTRLAPLFYISDGVNLYAAGSSAPEKSGESYHDFSKGPVHYTTASEDGQNQKNVWLTVKQEGTASTSYNLYTNSLEDSESNTRVENGVIYSRREIILENRDDGHDIFLVNMGSNDIPKLSVELSSDVLKLDEYWTLNGNHDLSAFAGVANTTQYGELANMAKVRLKMKDGVISGEEIKGTLTVKAAGATIMVLELTGIAGAPIITTESIPEAVKYVPYGTMIQNSNKYSKTRVKYELSQGTLPEGMELRENGELYGVPKETGTFDFWVRMVSWNPNSETTRKFTLEVKENTDENVDGATDSGYDVTKRIPTVAIGSTGSRDFVSQGVLNEFTDVYLDGEKLVKDVDYTAESGSTRLTIRSQTLTRSNTVGAHTLGVEFRTTDENLLKRAAQNFNVVGEGTAVDTEEPGSGNSENNSNSENNGGSGGESSSDSGSSGSSGNSGNTAGTPTAAAQDVAAVETLVYTIAPGDTLSKIALKYYGNVSMWRKIYEDNKDVIINPNRIRAGMRIKIYLVGTAAQQMNAPAAGKTYTVRRGDSLWKIAAQTYGKGWQWRRIYDANRNTIPATLVLRTGQVIVIP